MVLTTVVLTSLQTSSFKVALKVQMSVKKDVVTNLSGNELADVKVVGKIELVTKGTLVVRVGVLTHSAISFER